MFMDFSNFVSTYKNWPESSGLGNVVNFWLATL